MNNGKYESKYKDGVICGTRMVYKRERVSPYESSIRGAISKVCIKKVNMSDVSCKHNAGVRTVL